MARRLLRLMLSPRPGALNAVSPSADYLREAVRSAALATLALYVGIDEPLAARADGWTRSPPSAARAAPRGPRRPDAAADVHLPLATLPLPERDDRLADGTVWWQLVTESLLLSATGGALALPVAWAARGLLPFGQTSPLDWRVFAFAAMLSLAAGMMFSLVPALRATRAEPSTVWLPPIPSRSCRRPPSWESSRRPPLGSLHAAPRASTP